MEEHMTYDERIAAIYLFDFQADTYTLIASNEPHFSSSYHEYGSLSAFYKQEFHLLEESLADVEALLAKQSFYALTSHGEFWKQALLRRIPESPRALVYFLNENAFTGEEFISPKQRFDFYFKALYRQAFAGSEYDLTKDSLKHFDFHDESYASYFQPLPQRYPVSGIQYLRSFVETHVHFDQEGLISYFSPDYVYSLYHRGKYSSVYNFVIHVDDKPTLYVEVSSVFSLNQEGHMIVLSVFKDVTKRYEKEEERIRYLHLLKTLSQDYESVLLCEKDRKAEIYRLNSALEGHIVNGEDISQVFHTYASLEICQEDREAFLAYTDVDHILDHCALGESYRFRYRVHAQDSLEYHEVNIIKIGDEHDPLIVFGFTNVDADQRRKIETQDLLKEALNQAENANVAKGTFLSNMSHDMRTPMNAIVGFCEIAQSNLDDEGVLKYSLSRIMDASKSLLSIIDNALNVSRIESGRVHLHQKSAHLSVLLQTLKRELRPYLTKKKQVLQVKEHYFHDVLYMDQNKCKQVLWNILMNAIQYTPEGGHIFFGIDELTGTKYQYARFLFTIEDDGIGMSEEYLKNIYDPFSREENTTNSGVAGTGLGMTIAKNLIDMAGGHISITSHSHVGTKVIVELELKVMNDKPLAVSVPEKQQPIKSLKGRHILIVEDNALNAEITKTILESLDAKASVVGNGQLAVEALMQQPFDGVLMDIMMPVMDGLQATKAIRSFSDVPIIAMSANAFEEDKRRAFEAGVNDYVTKPFKTEYLLKVLGRWLGESNYDKIEPEVRE